VLVAVNNSHAAHRVTLEPGAGGAPSAWTSALSGAVHPAAGGRLVVDLPAKSGEILVAPAR